MVDMYKQRFTRAQEEILRFMFDFPEKKFNQREIAKTLNYSPTAIKKAVDFLHDKNYVQVKKNNSKILEIELNLENEEIIYLKKLENLRKIYVSGIIFFLEDIFPTKTIILFGSYSKGEDISSSDIDIAIIGSKEKEIPKKKFEKLLKRKINFQFYPKLNGIHKNLKENLLNGIILSGGVFL